MSYIKKIKHKFVCTSHYRQNCEKFIKSEVYFYAREMGLVPFCKNCIKKEMEQ